MPLYQELVNFNTLFSQLTSPPVIINDLSTATMEDREKIRNMITSRYSSDMMSILPSCQCGKTKGEFALATKCPHCGTEVVSVIEDSVEPLVWFRRPKEVAPLINPIVWIMLSERMTISGFNILQWIADSTYRPTVKTPDAILQKFIDYGIKRGYNNFYENFHAYIDFAMNVSEIRKRTKNKRNYLTELLEMKRDSIFSDYLPLPNKSLLIIEKNTMGTFIDPTVVKAMDAIEMITSIDSANFEHTNRVRENRTIKAIVKLCEFYYDFFKVNIAGKTGQFRKHILGSRTNFNFRAVVSSLTGIHHYEEIYAPWCVGLTAFRPQMINKLLNRGFTLNAAIEMLVAHVEKYHPLLDELLQEIVRETKDGQGIVVIENRNPTMLSGSIQKKRITKFKTDPGDHTVSTSIITVTAPNTDYDGDALNYSISLDNFLAEKWDKLSPHYNVFTATNPKEISNNISIPKPVISSTSNWIQNTQAPDPVKLERMKQLI